jgi:hypothetical protein
MAVITRVSRPAFSMASWRASALITVANIPMWSAPTRSIPWSRARRPRKMLPPPTTTASSTPRARTSTSCWAILAQTPGSEAVALRSHEGLSAELQEDASKYPRRDGGSLTVTFDGGCFLFHVLFSTAAPPLLMTSPALVFVSSSGGRECGKKSCPDEQQRAATGQIMTRELPPLQTPVTRSSPAESPFGLGRLCVHPPCRVTFPAGH